MGLTLKEKARIQNAVRGGMTPKAAPATPPPVPPTTATVVAQAFSDDMVIEITGTNGTSTIPLRPSEVHRLRGRYGRGPAFEAWVGQRIRDLLVSFGGG